MLLVTATLARSVSDAHGDCPQWAAQGECERNPKFMASSCARSCAAQAEAHSPECLEVVGSGGCSTADGLRRCRAACLAAARGNLTEDTEGNCWYWATDGECAANPAWMREHCGRSCSVREACLADPASSACARPFECPIGDDNAPDCAQRVLEGECRPRGLFHSAPLLSSCPLSCHLLDPPTASHTVTRPMVKRSKFIDAPAARHEPGRCALPRLLPLLGAFCTNDAWAAVPWHRRRRGCVRQKGPMTPRMQRALPKLAELPAAARGTLPDDHQVVPQVVFDAPRVRLLHGFVSAQEAAELIALAGSHFHRSSTARAGSDVSRTSQSATLVGSQPVVRAVRARIAFFCGYPESTLEPLQIVRYHPGEFYKPHNDYYNACETWRAGNRHFTFLGDRPRPPCPYPARHRAPHRRDMLLGHELRRAAPRT